MILYNTTDDAVNISLFDGRVINIPPQGNSGSIEVVAEDVREIQLSFPNGEIKFEFEGTEKEDFAEVAREAIQSGSEKVNASAEEDSVTVTNILYVDGVNGSDAGAGRGYGKYKTLWKALADAKTGDKIIVLPYAIDMTDTNYYTDGQYNLLKDGVDIEFQGKATLTTNATIIDDAGLLNNQSQRIAFNDWDIIGSGTSLFKINGAVDVNVYVSVNSITFTGTRMIDMDSRGDSTLTIDAQNIITSGGRVGELRSKSKVIINTPRLENNDANRAFSTGEGAEGFSGLLNLTVDEVILSATGNLIYSRDHLAGAEINVVGNWDLPPQTANPIFDMKVEFGEYNFMIEMLQPALATVFLLDGFSAGAKFYINGILKSVGLSPDSVVRVVDKVEVYLTGVYVENLVNEGVGIETVVSKDGTLVMYNVDIKVDGSDSACLQVDGSSNVYARNVTMENQVVSLDQTTFGSGTVVVQGAVSANCTAGVTQVPAASITVNGAFKGFNTKIKPVKGINDPNQNIIKKIK